MTFPNEFATPLIAVVIAGTILGFLRIVGFAYYRQVMWHNLKVEVHELRLRQQQRIQELAMSELDERDDASGDVVGSIGDAADAAPASEAA